MAPVRRRSLIKLLMSRRSIRVFKPSVLPEEVLELIIKAGRRAPTYLQAYTIIHVKNPKKIAEVAKLCHEEIVKNASAILLICADLYRPKLMLNLLNHNHVLQSDKHPIESLFAIFDAALVVENMIMAAEALGLGSVILDCPLLEVWRFAELFKLPREVVPIALLCIGERNESPPLRPRLPLSQIFYTDEYQEPDERVLKEYLHMLGKHMERENYVKKYAGMNMKYLDYLKMKTELTDEAKKLNDSISKYLKENFIKL